jgi:putative PIN family toxin of toxin-antitoxin system
MGDKPRYVIDANAIVSAFLFERSKPGRALQLALERGVILLSESAAAELAEVLRREKFERYVIRQKREELLKAFIQEATLVEVAERIDACRDPRDNKYLELAVSGGADCIVSGDEDLLVLNPFRGIAILRPAEFLKWSSE